MYNYIPLYKVNDELTIVIIIRITLITHAIHIIICLVGVWNKLAIVTDIENTLIIDKKFPSY